jgi:hypothetical protein
VADQVACGSSEENQELGDEELELQSMLDMPLVWGPGWLGRVGPGLGWVGLRPFDAVRSIASM